MLVEAGSYGAFLIQGCVCVCVCASLIGLAKIGCSRSALQGVQSVSEPLVSAPIGTLWDSEKKTCFGLSVI